MFQYQESEAVHGVVLKKTQQAEQLIHQTAGVWKYCSYSKQEFSLGFSQELVGHCHLPGQHMV